MNSAAGDIAAAFINARRNWKTLPEYPGERPSDLRSAYVIQDAALADWNRPIGGWKVGKINPPMSDELGANRLVGPVFADTVQREGQDSAQFPIFAGGFAAIEAEFMLRLAPQEGPLPATREAAMDWVDEVRIGLEVASSPYAAINVDGPCVTVSDHGNNAGLLLGACVDRTEWERLDDIAVSLRSPGARSGGRALPRCSMGRSAPQPSCCVTCPTGASRPRQAGGFPAAPSPVSMRSPQDSGRSHALPESAKPKR